jgi:hypothetical protein
MPSFYERVLPQVVAWLSQQPSPDLSSADWLLGDWVTGAHIYTVGDVEERDSADTKHVRWSKVMDGHALKLGHPDGDEHARAIQYLYVDPYDDAWVIIDFEPNVVHVVQRASGWRGGVLEFEGQVRIFDDVANWRHRIRRISDDEWRWENDEQQEDGTWLPIDYHWYRRIAG